MSLETDMAGKVKDERADELRQRFHEAFAAPEFPVPVEEIAEDLLGLAVGENEDLEVSGMLLPAERRIWLNASEGPARRRFTLAHELGHWVCQHLEGMSAPAYCRAADVQPEPSGTSRALEREANVFAAELLMPEPVVRDAWSRSATVQDLAAEFGVSPLAMHWRLYSFGLVMERPA
jgi:Zn-dependent peptidase ImmA (M78 family)